MVGIIPLWELPGVVRCEDRTSWQLRAVALDWWVVGTCHHMDLSGVPWLYKVAGSAHRDAVVAAKCGVA